jgi:hypothetical protein
MFFCPPPISKAQTDPPPLGDGDWIINDNTVISDTKLKIMGNIEIQSGGSLTLDNVTLSIHRYDILQSFAFNVRSGATLIVKGNSIISTYDLTYSLQIFPGSTASFKDCTLSGLWVVLVGTDNAVFDNVTVENMRGGIRVGGGVVGTLGKAVITNSTFRNNHRAIWVEFSSEVTVSDSYFELNNYGILGKNEWEEGFPPLCPHTNQVVKAYRNTFINNFYRSVYIAWSTRTEHVVQDNYIDSHFGDGIVVINTRHTLIKGNTIVNQRNGMNLFNNYNDDCGYYVPMAVDLVDNNVSLSTWKGILLSGEEKMDTSWEIHGDSRIYDTSLSLNTSINVKAGGRIVFEETEIGMHNMGNIHHGIIVEPSGTMEIRNSTLTKTKDTLPNPYLVAEPGSTLIVKRSNITHLGYEYGGDGSHSGMCLETDDFLISNSLIKDNFYGVTVSTGNGNIKNTTFENIHEIGVMADSSGVTVSDSELLNISNYDFKLMGGANVDVINSSYDESNIDVEPGSILSSYWPVDVTTRWQNREIVGGVQVDVVDEEDNPVHSGVSDENGDHGPFLLREFYHDGQAMQMTTPHTFRGSYKTIQNETLATIKEPTHVDLLIYDTVLPDLTVILPSSTPYYTINSTAFFNGTASDDMSGLDRVQYSTDNEFWYYANGLHEWNFTLDLKYGWNYVYVRAVDLAGNIHWKQLEILVDRDAPHLVVMEPDPNFLTGSKEIAVIGFAEMGTTVNVNGQEVKSVDGTFRVTVPLVEGPNQINVTCTDDTGNSNTTTIWGTRDTTPPSIDITSPKDYLMVNLSGDPIIQVEGTTEPDSLIYINGNSMNVQSDGSFNTTIGLGPGLNVISFTAKDGVGNANSTVRRVIYDKSPPRLNITSPDDASWTNKTVITVMGYSEEGAIIESGGKQTTVAIDGSWELEVELLKEDSNLITVSATDTAGNPIQRSIILNRDTIAPDITIFDYSDGDEVDAARIMIRGETEARATVKINNDLVKTGNTGLFSKWVYLPSANNEIRIVVMDEAGNLNDTNITIKRRVGQDTKPPVTTFESSLFSIVVALVVLIVIAQAAILYYLMRKQQLKKEEKERKRRELEEMADEDEVRRVDDEYDLDDYDEMDHDDVEALEHELLDDEADYQDEHPDKGGGRK